MFILPIKLKQQNEYTQFNTMFYVLLYQQCAAGRKWTATPPVLPRHRRQCKGILPEVHSHPTSLCQPKLSLPLRSPSWGHRLYLQRRVYQGLADTKRKSVRSLQGTPGVGIPESRVLTKKSKKREKRKKKQIFVLAWYLCSFYFSSCAFPFHDILEHLQDLILLIFLYPSGVSILPVETSLGRHLINCGQLPTHCPMSTKVSYLVPG